MHSKSVAALLLTLMVVLAAVPIAEENDGTPEGSIANIGIAWQSNELGYDDIVKLYGKSSVMEMYAYIEDAMYLNCTGQWKVDYDKMVWKNVTVYNETLYNYYESKDYIESFANSI